jgi:release factor glutamine methyltransferase
LREALRWGEQALSKSALDSPRLDAEILLTHALGITRSQLHAHPQSRLSSAELASYRQLIERRTLREPVAYIVGHKEFYGLDLSVDSRVLIPRPETELLVEKAIEISQRQSVVAGVCKSCGSERRLSSEAYRNQASGSWATRLASIRRSAPTLRQAQDDARPALDSLFSSQSPNSYMRPVIADVGTGSGAIAVSLAVHLPQAVVYATDASPEALEVAACNCRRHRVEDRVHLLQGHLLKPLPEPVDLIVANLPYVSQAELAQLPPEISLYEPREALDGGSDGLDHIRRLLAQAKGHLKPGGVVLLEIGATQGPTVVALAKRHFPASRVEIMQDYAGLDRVVMVSKGAKVKRFAV